MKTMHKLHQEKRACQELSGPRIKKFSFALLFLYHFIPPVISVTSECSFCLKVSSFLTRLQENCVDSRRTRNRKSDDHGDVPALLLRPRGSALILGLTAALRCEKEMQNRDSRK